MMRHTHLSPRTAGSVTLLVLLLLILFVIMMTVSVQFLARQSQRTVLQEQEEQGFGLADAGINYTAWLLSAAGGGFTPPELVSSPPPSAENHTVADSTGTTIGEFDLFFGPACEDSLQVRAIGYDQIKPDLCQVIDATFQQYTSGEFKTTAWDHVAGYPCGEAYIPPSPPPCGGASPSPTPTPTPSQTSTPTPTPTCDPTYCPVGWVCGPSGACEPTTCMDMSSCESGFVACPPDEKVGSCDAFFLEERWLHYECCEECNEALQNFCNIQGGYCVAEQYTVACPPPSPTVTPPPVCQPLFGACIASSDCCAPYQCTAGACTVGGSCVIEGLVCATDGTTPPCCAGFSCTEGLCQ